MRLATTVPWMQASLCFRNLFPFRHFRQKCGRSSILPFPGGCHVRSFSNTKPLWPRAGEPVVSFRAQRFNLHLPLKYRPLGEDDWRDGTTENISRSGMLFRAEESLPANVQLEINLVLPAEIAGLSAAEVVCAAKSFVRCRARNQPSVQLSQPRSFNITSSMARMCRKLEERSLVVRRWVVGDNPKKKRRPILMDASSF